jgi:hypothetical protein
LAVGTNNSTQYLKTLPLSELQQEMEAYAEYVEERNRIMKNQRQQKR